MCADVRRCARMCALTGTRTVLVPVSAGAPERGWCPCDQPGARFSLTGTLRNLCAGGFCWSLLPGALEGFRGRTPYRGDVPRRLVHGTARTAWRSELAGFQQPGRTPRRQAGYAGPGAEGERRPEAASLASPLEHPATDRPRPCRCRSPERAWLSRHPAPWECPPAGPAPSCRPCTGSWRRSGRPQRATRMRR
jgi:hypothetical protein